MASKILMPSLKKILKKIFKIQTMATPKFLNVKGSTFHQELKKRVNDYFVNAKSRQPAILGYTLKQYYSGQHMLLYMFM